MGRRTTPCDGGRAPTHASCRGWRRTTACSRTGRHTSSAAWPGSRTGSERGATDAKMGAVDEPGRTRGGLPGARAIVLVEGISDQIALETLAARRGRDLASEGISIVPIGGAQAVGRFLARFGTERADATLAGLCDEREEDVFRRSLERAGLGSKLTRVEMELLGFYVCVADLEDELIRALGAESVEELLAAQGDLRSFRTLQHQPAWHGRTREEQLRRFMGSGGRRKIRYARLLVEALDLRRAPRPLSRLLAHV